MVSLTLSSEELRLLIRHLSRHIGALDADLVRTDHPALQHEFAREIEALRVIERRLADLSEA
jgi:hypothetical protein